jgi:hypothetical protein
LRGVYRFSGLQSPLKLGQPSRNLAFFLQGLLLQALPWVRIGTGDIP